MKFLQLSRARWSSQFVTTLRCSEEGGSARHRNVINIVQFSRKKMKEFWNLLARQLIYFNLRMRIILVRGYLTAEDSPDGIDGVRHAVAAALRSRLPPRAARGTLLPPRQGPPPRTLCWCHQYTLLARIALFLDRLHIKCRKMDVSSQSQITQSRITFMQH